MGKSAATVPAAWEVLSLPVFIFGWCRAWSAPCARHLGLQRRVLRAGADEHDRRAEVLRGDVDGIVVQAEWFGLGGLGLGHDAHTSRRSAITHTEVCGVLAYTGVHNAHTVRQVQSFFRRSSPSSLAKFAAIRRASFSGSAGWSPSGAAVHRGRVGGRTHPAPRLGRCGG